ncbi:urease accessory protein UreD [Dactylosporangium sp. AC04546]|uniref:urease accessory protein UreD n=1 Tax=Dactylosporangium sp. AC04546 TaxID=2862460 RepID=UPI001EDF615C|nr:urease accessory protein UreD [Dactylosporangium sp. AC04546]WVK84978.1 urease accessory protein UreD [Dactylosporangium sp. AC04546]
MRAAARVVAEEGGRLTVLKGEAPLLPRRTGPNEVHFVGGAAGPLGGDELSIELEVGPGALLVVRTVAASIALPGRDGAWSRLSIHASVAGTLLWLPEPTIAAANCRHLTESTVDLAGDATLVWREEVVRGRHGEQGGEVRLSTAVRRAGRPFHRSDVTLEDNPAVMQHRVYAGLVTTRTVDHKLPEIMPLAAGGTLVTALGDDLAATRAITDLLVTAPQ